MVVRDDVVLTALVQGLDPRRHRLRGSQVRAAAVEDPDLLVREAGHGHRYGIRDGVVPLRVVPLEQDVPGLPGPKVDRELLEGEVFAGGALSHTAVIPIGGENFSSDLAYGLKIPHHISEKIKRRYGTVLSDAVDPVAAVKLDDRYYNASFMSQILEYRAREVFEFVRESLEKARVHNLLPGGAILTGGGSLLDGMTDLAEDILGMRARTATPRRVRGEIKPVQKPQYATSVGLLYFSARHGEPGPKVKGAGATSFGSIVEAVRSWFRGG